MTDREIIDKIYNLIATTTDFITRTECEKEIVSLINKEIYLKER